VHPPFSLKKHILSRLHEFRRLQMFNAICLLKLWNKIFYCLDRFSRGQIGSQDALKRRQLLANAVVCNAVGSGKPMAGTVLETPAPVAENRGHVRKVA
jgi:hypothetical protein